MKQRNLFDIIPDTDAPDPDPDLTLENNLKPWLCRVGSTGAPCWRAGPGSVTAIATEKEAQEEPSQRHRPAQLPTPPRFWGAGRSDKAVGELCKYLGMWQLSLTQVRAASNYKNKGIWI